MTISVLQSPDASNSTSAANIALTLTVTAHSTLVVYAACDSSGGSTITGCSDTLNGSYGAALDAVNDATSGDRLSSFAFVNTVGGSNTVTVTFSPNAGSRAIIVFEVGGASTILPIDKHTGQNQVSPGTGTDATTSGGVTNTYQPALIVGFSYNTSSVNRANSGTAFTNDGVAWNFGSTGNETARSEDKRITNYVSQAATFTATAGTDRYLNFIVMVAESGAQTNGTTIAWLSA